MEDRDNTDYGAIRCLRTGVYLTSVRACGGQKTFCCHQKKQFLCEGNCYGGSWALLLMLACCCCCGVKVVLFASCSFDLWLVFGVAPMRP